MVNKSEKIIESFSGDRRNALIGSIYDLYSGGHVEVCGGPFPQDPEKILWNISPLEYLLEK